MRRNVIQVDWDFPTYSDGEIVELDMVRYHILAYVGSYDFASALVNATIEEIIVQFEHDSLYGNGTTLYHVVDGNAFQLSLNTTYHGELHTLLVIAEVDDVLSRNNEATSVYVSSSDPIRKDNLKIVGVFFPTENLNVTLNADNSLLQFNGPVRQEHLDLTEGEYILGYTTDFNLFLLLVLDIVEASNQKVVLATEMARVEDLFDSLDYESSHALSRPNKVETSPTSRHMHRNLNVRRQHSRRLWGFINDIGNAFKDAGEFFVDDVFKPIGDAVVDLGEDIVGAFEDLYNALTKGEVKKTFELVDFDVAMNQALVCDGCLEDDISLTPGKVTGKVMARSDLYIRMKVSTSSPNLLVEAGWVAEYSADLDIEMLNEVATAVNKNLWEGKKKRFVFTVVVVPVTLSVQPKVDAELGIAMSSNIGEDGGGMLKIKAGGKGSGRAIAGSELPPRLFAEFKAPGRCQILFFQIIHDYNWTSFFLQISIPILILMLSIACNLVSHFQWCHKLKWHSTRER